ncbi:MAG: DUF393 domain-containing protein [Dehalococcoidia bacterium]|nr:DUF393 domain-containing protein [Dehalococcoidia bacterium]
MSTLTDPSNPTTTGTHPASPAFAIELFYDGDCPLCKREVALLRRMDPRSRMRFTDIATPGFDAAEVGVPWQALLDRIHGRLSDGSVIEGVEVFRRLYGAVGFGPLVAVSRLPGISHLLEVVYRVFAKNRLRLTGRCHNGVCEVAPPHTQG